MSAELYGDKKLNTDLLKHRNAVKRRTGVALRAGGMLIRNAAQTKAPVLTGNLKRSINVEAIETGAVQLAIIGTEVSYAPHMEYGTTAHTINSSVFIKGVGWRYIGKHPGTKARPFLRPAFDEQQDAAIAEVEAVLDQLVKKWR